MKTEGNLMAEAYEWKDFPDWITSVKKGDHIEIWTDGGCKPNPGFGGWGAVLQKGNVRCILMGGGQNTTNNRMELLAAITALESLPKKCKVVLHTDSQYVINGITKWIYGWVRRGWVRQDGTEVINADLWKSLAAQTRNHTVATVWIKGHRGHNENELCDYLATYSRLLIKETVNPSPPVDPRTLDAITFSRRPKNFKSAKSSIEDNFYEVYTQSRKASR